MKYELIETNKSDFTVVKLCRVFQVKVSGYYRWRNKKRTPRQVEDEILIDKIRDIHKQSKETYGPVRIQKEMKKNDVLCSIGRTRRLMRENGLYSISKKKFIHYNDINMDKKFSENILNREFESLLPNEVWCGDITYVKAVDGWVYLAVVMDLFNREIIGYALSKKANSQLTIHAMADALMNRKPQSKIMFHSDRGSQYSSKAFTRYLDDHNIFSSMSRRGSPYDNACSESFFATLKKEWTHHRKYKNIEHLRQSLFEYIDLFYNRKRLHSHLDYLSPIEYYKRHRGINNAKEFEFCMYI
jgi:putative transposase